MKKKVLALVVLAAMLISILPMAAFAAASPYGAIVEAKDTEATADMDDYLEFNVFVKAAGATFGSDAEFIIASSRTIDKIYAAEDDAADDNSPAPGVKTVTLDSSKAAQWVNVKIYSDTAGTAKIAFGIGSSGDIVDFAKNNKLPDNSTSEILTGQAYSVAFTSSDANKVELKPAGAAVYANGSSYHEVEAYVTSNNIPVKGTEVTFTITAGTGATLSNSKATTDAQGKATVKLFSTKSTTPITVEAKVGDGKVEGSIQRKTTQNYTFLSTGIVDIKATSDNNQKIAKGSDLEVKFNFFDAKNNKITANNNFGDSSNLKGAEIITVTKPSGAAIKDKIHEQTPTATSYTWNGEQLTIDSNWINKEGAYSIRFSLANGKSAIYDFTVKEQSTVTEMTIKYDSPSYAMNFTNHPTPTVKLLDAEGYAKKATDVGDQLKFTVSDPSIVTVDGSTGALTRVEDKSGAATVTVVNDTKSLVASTTIEIQKAAATLKVTAPSYTAAGDEAKLTVQLVDIDGKPVASDVAATEVKAYATSKPDDSVFSSGSTDTIDFVKNGKATIDVVGNKVGVYKVQVAITAGSKVYVGTCDVSFGSETVSGNDIIFIIGASSYVVDGKPVAATSVPFIENGRTFLGIRDMGLAIGIIGDENIVWDKATQTAKLVKDGITVEVTVGATAIKVTKNSVTTEVAIDAPAQNKDGRVFLPFRAVFQAFGYAVEYANGVITCI